MKRSMDRAGMAPIVAMGLSVAALIIGFLIGAGLLALQYWLITRFDWPTWCWVCLVIQLIFFVLGTLSSWVKLFLKIGKSYKE